jgi:signal transduction histidine kinase
VVDLKISLQSVVDKKHIVTFLIRGAESFYLTSVSPCYMGVSSVISLVVCVLDVSIWQRAKETREDLMRFLSHDIRSPIASIIMAVDDANLSTGENEEQRELLGRVKQAAERSLKLADNFLHLAKAESIDPERFVELDLFDIIEIAIDELWPQAKQNGIKLVLDQSKTQQEEGAWSVGDRDLLIRVVINLGLNAIKYSPACTMVTFSIEEGGQFWVIHVADQGSGIAQDQFSQIFNKFGRIRQQDGNYKSGIGLGLMIVKTVVDRHHGHVNVQSTIGQGSCFSVHLPAVMAPDFEDE